jgi:hypothetical protein
MDGGEVVSLMRLPPFIPGRFPVLISVRGVTTFGDPSVIGEKTDLLNRIRREVNEQNLAALNFTAFSPQQSPNGNTVKFEHVMKVVSFFIFIGNLN